MPVISFASSKGGAGKTTSAIILGTELAQGTSVTMIDADPAGRLARWSELAPLSDNLTVLVSGGERHIQAEIEEAASKSTVVIIDLEGTASRLTSFAIAESDLVIIPTAEEQQDANEALETLAEVRRESRARRQKIPAVILKARTAAAVKSKLEKHIAAELEKAGRVLKTELNRRTAFSSLHNAGGGLRELDPNDVNGIDKAIVNAEAYAAEVFEILMEADNA
ncbi:ParA family protein [Thioclava sp. GXIMD4216]|uniref:ParA family protein n=1 Tax=Thioclava sp. GXIMD4216 TaxID=3131929 RepID=UPI0030CD6574